eukprot:Gb_19890 [translate_table: standard]
MTAIRLLIRIGEIVGGRRGGTTLPRLSLTRAGIATTVTNGDISFASSEEKEEVYTVKSLLGSTMMLSVMLRTLMRDAGKLSQSIATKVSQLDLLIHSQNQGKIEILEKQFFFRGTGHSGPAAFLVTVSGHYYEQLCFIVNLAPF